jgi:DNA gyrase subunit A
VRIFKTDAEEKVVSVERIPDDGSSEEAGPEDEAGDGTDDTASGE